ncbi:hypothetical protein [Litorisediminicola beolgyonensis]|uniref:Uncharacterized protein n=1 Tax=Litorisediminicola beolgyonensis TaxID=1173614 RepID=A0ABW3ZI86_9RHOB
MKRPALTIGNITSEPVEITKQKFNEYISCSKDYETLYELEDYFSVFAKAYVQFEKTLLEATLHHRLDSQIAENFLIRSDRDRILINSAIINLLTAFRSYEEFCFRIKFSEPDGKRLRDPIKQNFSQAFDESLCYRLCCALRNISLHQALPITSLRYENQNQWRGETRRKRPPQRTLHGLNISIETDIFSSNSRVRAETRKELSEVKEKYIDAKLLIRAFSEKLFHTHQRNREVTNPLLVACHRTADSAISFFSQSTGETPERLFMVDLDEIPVEPIFFHGIDKSLMTRSRASWLCLNALKTMFVSSEIRKNRDTFYPHPDVWVP